MITLYIPTTILNFNNILSSESISPEAFYALREFGYSKWSSIAEENNKNVILLYDKPFSFKTPNEDREDHPLIIEVNLDDAQIKEYAPHVYYCDHTIYLDPWNASFIFLTEKEKLIALSMSDSSLETKLTKLYRKKIKVNVDLPAKEIYFEKTEIPLNEKGVECDFTINRIKGLLYGYYIGANISSNKEDVSMINDFRELTNILSSIQSSENHSPSKPQEERLKALLNIGSKLYRKDIENGDMLKRAGAQLSDLDKKLTRGNELLKPQSHEIVIEHHHVSKIESITNEEERCLFQSWTDFFFGFASNKFNRNIGTINAELSDKLTYKAKDVFGTNWEGSFARKFLNNLRHHIRGNVFEEEWNNGLLSSLAAVLTHGDDWHNLLLFMQSKGMYDYRLAYALYGVLHGFANLTRDFTDIIFNEPSEYIAQVYMNFYKQVFGIELKIGKESLTAMSVKTNQEESQVEGLNVVSDKDLTTRIKAEAPSMKLSKDQSKSLNTAISENGSNQDPNIFIGILSQLKGWKKGPKLKAMKEMLMPSSQKRQIAAKSQKETKQLNLFSSSQSQSATINTRYGGQYSQKHFAFDDAAWEKIEDLVPTDAKEKIYKDYDWFVKEIRKDPYERQYYKHLDSRDDGRVIETFVSLKSKPKNGKYLAPYFTPELRQKIKEKLLSLYCK